MSCNPFSCDELSNLTEEGLLRKSILADDDGCPVLNTSPGGDGNCQDLQDCELSTSTIIKSLFTIDDNGCIALKISE